MATFGAGNGAIDDTNDATMAVTLTGVTAGDLIVGVAKWEGTNVATLNSVSDGTTSMTLDALGTLNHANNDLNSRMFYLLSSVASGSLTYTMTLSASRPFKQLAVARFTYTGTASRNAANQTTVTAPGAPWTVVSGNISPSGTELVVCGFWGNYFTNTPSNHLINGVAEDGIFGTANGTQGWYRLLSTGFTNGQATLDEGAGIDANGHIIAFAITSGGQPTMRRWGGVPFVGGQGVNQSSRHGSGRMWARRDSGVIVPRWLKEAA